MQQLQIHISQWTFRKNQIPGYVHLRVLLIYFSIIILIPSFIRAQQDPQYSQYLFNGLVINPAYAGSRGTIGGALFFRKQWVGFDGAPVTQSVSFQMPNRTKRYGFGMSLTNDKIGYVNQQWMNLCYAFRIPLGKGNLALGLQGGFLNYRINWERAQVYDANDPVLPVTPQNFLLPNVGTGIYYSTNYFYAGVSSPHLLNTAITQNKNTNKDFARLYRHYFFTIGYVIGRVSAIKCRPSVLLKYTPGAPLQADLNLNFLFVDRFWVGASWRTFDSAVLMTEFLITPGFKVGYAYDFTTSGLRKYTSGSHEIMISYEVLQGKVKMKSPRYF